MKKHYSYLTLLLFTSIGLIGNIQVSLGQCSGAPTISTPTVTAITSTGATLGANMTANGGGGGCNATYGIRYSTSTPVNTSNETVVGSSTTSALFTQAVAGLTPATQYYYTGYATNVGEGGTTGTSTTADNGSVFFWTLDSDPGATPGGLVFTATGTASEIQLAFDAASTVPADGYIIFRKAGSAPSTATTDGADPAGFTDYLTTISSNSQTSFNDATAIGGTSYTYAIVPFNFGADAATYNYGTAAAATPSATRTLEATVTSATGGVSTTIVATNTNRAIIGFNIQSNGTQEINEVVFDLTSVAGLSNFELINNGTTATYAGGGSSLGTVAPVGTTITFTGLTEAIASPNNYFFLIVDVDAGASAGNTTPSLTSITTDGTETGDSFAGSSITINALAATIDKVTGGVSTSVVGGATDKAIIGFRVRTNGTTQSLDDLVFTLDIDPTTGPLSNFQLVNNGTTATYTAGGGSVLGTVPSLVGGPTNTVTFNNINQAISTTPTYTYFFLIADVDGGASSGSFTTTLTSVTTDNPSITGAPFSQGPTSITGLSSSIAQLTTGLATSPLTAGVAGTTTANAIFGFSFTTNGTQDIDKITIKTDTDPAARFTSFSLVESPDNSFATTGSHAVVVANANIAVTGTGPYSIEITPASPLTVDATTKYYFLVATVSGTVTTGTASITASLSTADLILDPATITANSFNGTTYSFQPSQASTIIFQGSPSSAINYASFQTASSITSAGSATLGTFRIRDGGGAADTDGLGTTLTNLSVSVGNYANVRTIAVFDGTTNVAEVTNVSGGTGTVNFSGLNLTAADGANKDFLIRATFNTTVTDNQYTQITVTSATASTAGSNFATSNAGGATSGATSNDIEVTASKLLFTTVPGSNPTPGATFSVVVSATDANNNVDTDGVTDQVSITKNGGGSLTGGGAISPSSGTYTFNSLSISIAGTFTLTADDPNGNGTGQTLAAGTYDITIQSTGVVITPATNTPLDLCYGGDFQSIGTITITESDPADFETGGYFYLKLPTGFSFNTAITPTVGETGNEVTINSLGAAANYYIGNEIVRINYSVSGTSNVTLDAITIGGLQVKYPLTTATPGGDITVLNGSASQVGNTETDAENHGTLSASDQTLALYPSFDFIVDELAGDPPVNSTDTRFSATTNSIKLLAGASTPSGGVFTGNGVSFSGTNGYVFSPKSVGDGNYNVTYTVTDPNSPGCSLTKTKTFEVYSTAISGLALTYCNNSSPATMSVTQGAVDQAMSGYGNYGPGTSDWVFYEFVYYDANVGNYLSIPSPNNSFNPQASIYQTSILNYGGVYIYFKAQNIEPTSPYYNAIYYGNYQFVPVYTAPAVSFSIQNPTGIYCATDDPYSIIASPAPTNNSTDFFTGTGVSEVSTNTWEFDPGAVPGGSLGSPLMITYQYTDPYTNCSNSTSQTITVYGQPSAPVSSDFYLYNNNTTAGSPTPTTYACQFGGFDYIVSVPNACCGGSVTANDNRFNWYSNAALGAANQMYAQNWFFYPYTINSNTPGTTSFYVTQVVNGCESPSLEIKATVNQAPTVEAGNNRTICSTDDVILSTLSPSIGGSSTAGGSYWTTGGDGVFLDASDDPIVGNAFFNLATQYQPGANDILNQFVYLYLNSNDPDGAGATGPCFQVSDVVIINISPSPTAVAGRFVLTPPGDELIYCANQTMTLTGFVSGATAGTTTTWTVDQPGGTIESPNVFNSVYTPSATQLALGATLTFTLTTNDPDGAGPCTASTDDVILKINQRATISAGTSFEKCSDEVIQMSGSIPANSATNPALIMWTGGAGSFDDPTSLTPIYTYAPAEIGTSITFTLTSNDPDGAEPCTAEASTISVSIKADPPAPSVILPAPYCVTPGINGATDPLQASGVNVIWYDDPGLLPGDQRATGNSFATGITTITDIVTNFYVTQTVNGCESTYATSTIIVNPAPNPIFSVQNFCLGDQTQFTDASTLIYNNGLSGSITGWAYDFGNGFALSSGSGAVPSGTHNGNTTGTYENPIHEYGNTGLFNPTLTVRTSDGCTNSVSYSTLNGGNSMRIGSVPKANFTFKKMCEGDITDFFGLSNGNTDLGPVEDPLTWTWDFKDAGASDLTDPKNPKHTFTAPGTYFVDLTVTTPLNCTNTVSLKVPILPYISTFPYVADFDGSDFGFADTVFVSAADASSWRWDTPDGSVMSSDATGGGQAWFTRADGESSYYNSERSALYTPCFNISALDRPVLSFDRFASISDGNDGMYMQYAIPDVNGNLNWIIFGERDSGIDWYDRQSIVGLTVLGGIGQNLVQVGWGNDTNGAWSNSRYSLDDLATDTKVQFRIIFGSNAENPDPTEENLDGYGIDNFSLLSRNRQVLLENFTNNNQDAFNNAFVSVINGLLSEEYVKIQYHTNLEAGVNDPINNQAPADPNARAAYYGLTNTTVPRVFIDGQNNFFNFTQADKFYNRQTLINSKLELAVTTLPSVDPGSMTIEVTIDALEDILSPNLVLHTVVLEQDVIVNSEEFENVVRKFLPNAAGKPLGIINQFDQIVETVVWEVNNVNINPAKLALVAFVQNVTTKEVYQAVINTVVANPPTIVTGLEDPDFASKINIHPNPANQEMNVVLPGIATTHTPLVMVDAHGKAVYQNAIPAGENSKTINTSEMTPGVYILQLGTPGGGVVRKKVMVVH